MATNTNIESYLEKIKSAESGGNRYAKNPYGSASGLFQFTKDTWRGLGYDWNDRFDPTLQHEAAVKFTNNNANYLRKNLGIEPTHADLYGAHFLGAVGYKNLYKTADDRPISDVMSQKEINSNPFVKGKTVGFVKEWLRKKTKTKASGTPQQEVKQEIEYDDSPVGNFYADGTVRLNEDSGDYITAPDYEAPSEYEEDVEGNTAKEELRQAQQEKNFLEEIGRQNQMQQEEVSQGYPQNNSGYELYMPELPEFQAQQAPSYFQVGGQKMPAFTGFTKQDLLKMNGVTKPPVINFKPSKNRYKNVKIKDERLEGLQVKDNTNTYQIKEARQQAEIAAKDKTVKKQADEKWNSLMALDKDVNKALEKSSVIELQKKLYSLGYDLGDFGKNKDGIDGLMGGKTKKALELYKKYGDKFFEGDAENPLSLEQEERIARLKKPEEKGLELSDFKPGIESVIPGAYPLKVAGKLIGSIPGVDYIADNVQEHIVNPIKTKASEFLPYNLQYKPELNTTGQYDNTKGANRYLLDNMSLQDIRKQKNVSFLQISKNKLEGNSLLPTTLKERIVNATNAQGYMPDYEIKDGELNLPFFDRLTDEKSKTQVVKGLPGDKGKKREDIYRMYSGLPQKHDTFTASSFKAGADSDTNVTFKNPKDVMDYLKIAATHTDLFERLANGQITPESIARDAKSKKKGAEKINKAAFRDPKNVMWNATFGVNFDKKGNAYLSFYDNWDLKGKDDNVITGNAFGKPIEVYDRIPLSKELVQKLSKLNYKFSDTADSDAFSETDEKGNEAALKKVTEFIDKDPKLKKEYERLSNMVAQRYK
jgi:hypothetical protein